MKSLTDSWSSNSNMSKHNTASSFDNKQQLIVSIGITITAIYLILGLLIPFYDWDIRDWMALQGSSPIGFYHPVMPHSVVPGIMVGLFANMTGIALFESHIIVSCLFSGIGLTVLMLFSYKITGKLVASIILGIMFSFTRTFLMITLSGENDLIGAFYVALILYLVWKFYREDMVRADMNIIYLALGIMAASLTLFHLQWTVVGIVLPGMFVLVKENISFRELPRKIADKEFLTSTLLAYAGYGIGMIVVFALVSPLMGYEPVSLDLLSDFVRLNLSTTESFTSNPDWFFLASGRTVTEQLDIFFTGMVRAFYYNQFAIAGDFLATNEFPFVALSVIFCINPIVNYIFLPSEDHKRGYFRILLVCELFYAIYMFMYEPHSLERWSPFVILMCWHNALILDFPVLNNLNMNRINENKFLMITSGFFGFIGGLIVDQTIIHSGDFNVTDITNLLTALNLVVVIIVGIIVLTPQKWARSFRGYRISLSIGFLLCLFVGFFAYLYFTSVFLYLLSCNASQAGWC
ncbi:MAG: hypothetical protein ACFFD4_34740 [Candidatus Odinarchaeota archaeon]